MMYYDFDAGNNTYQLRLNTKAIITLEKKLNKNPILVFINPENKNTPTLEEMVTILEVALKDQHPEADVYKVFDEWLADGHIVGEFSKIIIDLYKLCGLFKKDDEEKN